MVRSRAATVELYLAELPDDRRSAIEAVRSVILANLPDGIAETMNWGMIAYEIPLSTYSATYNGQPLTFAALGSQKNYMAVYLQSVYGNDDLRTRFEHAYAASGKRLDMGKSCVRFRRIDDLPLDVVADAIASCTVAQYIEHYELARPAAAARRAVNRSS